MSSTRNYSWITPLGGFVGIVICMVFAAFFNAPPAWEQQIYSNISKSTDPAIALIGFDDNGSTLYVRSQSQKIYGCKVTWSNDATATTCFETGPDIIKKLRDPAPCSPSTVFHKLSDDVQATSGRPL
jgi:hypothetical protein